MTLNWIIFCSYFTLISLKRTSVEAGKSLFYNNFMFDLSKGLNISIFTKKIKWEEDICIQLANILQFMIVQFTYQCQCIGCCSACRAPWNSGFGSWREMLPSTTNTEARQTHVWSAWCPNYLIFVIYTSYITLPVWCAGCSATKGWVR